MKKLKSILFKTKKESNWLLIESNIKWVEKDYSQAAQWFNNNIFNGNQDIYTPTCYSYVMNATDYLGLPCKYRRRGIQIKMQVNI